MVNQGLTTREHGPGLGQHRRETEVFGDTSQIKPPRETVFEDISQEFGHRAEVRFW